MRIILVPDHKTNRPTRTFQARNLLIVAGCLIGLLPVLVGFGAYHISTALDRDRGVDAHNHEQVRRALRDQQRELADARSHVDHHLNTLTRQLGRVQAQVTRINALGQRVADTLGLDLEEFSFGREPAVGGPETPTNWEERVESDLAESLHRLEGEVAEKENELRILAQMLTDQKSRRHRFPSGLPVKGGWISSAYGYRNDPFSGRRAFHGGVDIAGRDGAPIEAVASGVVIHAGRKPRYGITVEINHGGGYVTRYAHTKEARVVAGERVKKGQIIALMGSSGRSTGPHLHFEVVKNDRTVNPKTYLRASR